MGLLCLFTLLIRFLNVNVAQFNCGPSENGAAEACNGEEPVLLQKLLVGLHDVSALLGREVVAAQGRDRNVESRISLLVKFALSARHVLHAWAVPVRIHLPPVDRVAIRTSASCRQQEDHRLQHLKHFV